MPIIPLFDGRSNSCTLGGYKISGLSVQSQGVCVTDDGSSVLSVIPVDHVRVGNTHTDQGSGGSVEAVAFRAFEDGDKVFLQTVYNFAGAGEQVVM